MPRGIKHASRCCAGSLELTGVSLQGMPLQAPMGPTLKPSRSTPVIPEEGPAPSIADFPRSSLDAARMMPTLLEQLKVSTDATSTLRSLAWRQHPDRLLLLLCSD